MADFGDFLVIRTDYYKSTTNENIYGINEHGQKSWQIKKMETLTHKGNECDGINDLYAGLKKIDDNRIKLFNWDSTSFEIDPRTGELLTDSMESRMGKKPCQMMIMKDVKKQMA